MSQLVSIANVTTITSLHPCAIETLWCKLNDNCCVENDAAAALVPSSSFLCGQYELDASTAPGDDSGATRNGQIDLFNAPMRRDNSDPDSRAQHRFTHPTASGVLDMKVAGRMVASVLSNSTLTVDHWHSDSEAPASVETFCCDGEGLFLSVDWALPYTTEAVYNRLLVQRAAAQRSAVQLAVSTQEGSILVYEMGTCSGGETRALTGSDNNRTNGLPSPSAPVFHAPAAHHMCGQNMPAWIVCTNPHQPSTLVSGGDDCLLKLWDIRSGTTPVGVNKTHGVGVTTAQWHPLDPHTFVSGSYDEHVRVWDERAMRSPVAEMHTGGGVWRVKWNLLGGGSGGGGSADGLLFMACMQGGCVVAEYRSGVDTGTSGAGAGTGEREGVEANGQETGRGVDGGKGREQGVGLTVVGRRIDDSAQHLSYGIDMLSAETQPHHHRHPSHSTHLSTQQHSTATARTTANTETEHSRSEEEEGGRGQREGHGEFDRQLVVTVASCSFYDNTVSTWQIVHR